MKKFYFLPSLLIIILVPVLIIVSLITSESKGKKVNTDNGESYLEALNELDIQDIQDAINGEDKEEDSSQENKPPREDVTKPTEELVKDESFYGSNQSSYVAYYFDEEEAEKTAQAVVDKTISTKDVFKNTLFVGNSIMTGFSDFQFANKGNVIATVGARLNSHLADNIQTIADYNPEFVVINYGINEMEENQIYLDNFIKTYTEDLKELKEKAPDTKIIVASITPVKAEVVKEKPRFSRVEAYNIRIRQMCVELGVSYVENSILCVSNPDLYAADGIHMQKRLYDMWIQEYLIKEMGIY